MTVSTFVPNPSGNHLVDSDFSVLTRSGVAFAPHAQAAPNMTIMLDAGHIFNGSSLIEVPTQNTSIITPPTESPRIDRVVIDKFSGVSSVVTGTENTSPLPPAIPSETVPVAQIVLQPSTISITNDLIKDERALNSLGISTSGPSGSGGLLNVQTFSTPGTFTYTPTSGTNKIIVEVIGGGAAGGASTTTGSNQVAIACGGGAGAYAKALITSGFSGVTITVAQGGPVNPPGTANGANGGTSSFGSLVSAPGGMGGFAGVPVFPPFMGNGSFITLMPTGGNIINSAGQQGAYGFAMSTTNVGGGQGGPSVFGGGGGGGVGFAGTNAVAPGAGGGGGASQGGQSPGFAGGAGGNGHVIVYEFS